MASFATNESNYDNLLVGGKEFTTERGVLLSGQDVTRGTALGKITSGGKLRTWGSGGSDDGHRTFFAIFSLFLLSHSIFHIFLTFSIFLHLFNFCHSPFFVYLSAYIPTSFSSSSFPCYSFYYPLHPYYTISHLTSSSSNFPFI